jgi:hypothetical protein
MAQKPQILFKGQFVGCEDKGWEKLSRGFAGGARMIDRFDS